VPAYGTTGQSQPALHLLHAILRIEVLHQPLKVMSLLCGGKKPLLVAFLPSPCKCDSLKLDTSPNHKFLFVSTDKDGNFAAINSGEMWRKQEPISIGTLNVAQIGSKY